MHNTHLKRSTTTQVTCYCSGCFTVTLISKSYETFFRRVWLHHCRPAFFSVWLAIHTFGEFTTWVWDHSLRILSSLRFRQRLLNIVSTVAKYGLFRPHIASSEVNRLKTFQSLSGRPITESYLQLRSGTCFGNANWMLFTDHRNFGLLSLSISRGSISKASSVRLKSWLLQTTYVPQHK
jgi:hypothetical protein